MQILRATTHKCGVIQIKTDRACSSRFRRQSPKDRACPKYGTQYGSVLGLHISPALVSLERLRKPLYVRVIMHSNIAEAMSILKYDSDKSSTTLSLVREGIGILIFSIELKDGMSIYMCI